MKKIINIFLLAGLGIFAACDNDLLEPFTPGSLTEDVAITSSTDLQRLLNSSMNLLTNREDIVFSSVFTDEVGIGFANGGQGLASDYIFFLNSSSAAPAAIWNSCYFSLSRTNRVIKFSDVVTASSPQDQQLINRTKAEALILRALAHLKIMSYFSPNPKDNAASAGVLADRVFSTSNNVRVRATNGEFYTLIHKDLDDAIAILTSNTATAYAATARTYYPGINAAKALKARAYALKGDYTNAEIWADDVIANSGIALANKAQYTQVFWTDNEPANTEVIFRLKRTVQQNTQASNLHTGWCSIRPNLAGSPFYEVGRSLFNKLAVNAADDVRYAAIVAPSSVIDANYATSTDYRNTDKLILHKHGGVGTGTATFAVTATNGNNNDHKILRLSEMYFIKAEARANANDLVGAATAVKAILDARFGSSQALPVYANQTAAWAGILAERRLEFAYEGYRFIDLKRIGALAGASLDRDPADYSSSSANYPAANPANLPLTSYKWALPIPQDEINASGIPQNTGY